MTSFLRRCLNSFSVPFSSSFILFQAFAEVDADALEALQNDVDALRDVLLRHVVPGSLLCFQCDVTFLSLFLNTIENTVFVS